MTSLRSRLTLATIGIVAASVVSLSTVHLNRLITERIDNTAERAQATAQLVKSIVLERVSSQAGGPADAPSTLAASKRVWAEMLERDRNLPPLLAGILAQDKSVVEISLADEWGLIIASSNPARVDTLMTARLAVRALQNLGFTDRLAAILGGTVDYESRVQLGVPEQDKPIFTIQVLVSSVLQRETLLPEILRMAKVSFAALALSILFAYWSARLALRPLVRISRTIDRIAKGETAAAAGESPPATREFAIVEQKLNLLGQQFRGVQQDARLAAISRLTGGVAHEIKNPLNSIALRLELLRSRILDKVPEATPELEVIAQEVTRLDRVVRTFLDFTRPVKLAYRNVDIVKLLEDSLTLVRPEAERAGVQLEFAHPDHVAPLRGDADLLRQAISNVVGNALEAMPSGGRLTVAVRPEEGYCTVSVADTGPGISQENRERIFQLYFTTKPQGSGLGLAMTFRAVQLHGGTIELIGEDGQGTTFLIRLPLAAPETIA